MKALRIPQCDWCEEEQTLKPTATVLGKQKSACTSKTAQEVPTTAAVCLLWDLEEKEPFEAES